MFKKTTRSFLATLIILTFSAVFARPLTAKDPGTVMQECVKEFWETNPFFMLFFGSFICPAIAIAAGIDDFQKCAAVNMQGVDIPEIPNFNGMDAVLENIADYNVEELKNLFEDYSPEELLEILNQMGELSR